jgi:hypothetical protein
VVPEGFEDWSGRTFNQLDLTGARFKETILVDARFSGMIDGLVINDIEVAPLIVAEMNRRFPERAQLCPRDADGVRAAWDIIEGLWSKTKVRVAALPEHVRQASVDDEWSCTETFRHLIFVTDGWITRRALGRDDPHHPLGVPPSFLADLPGIDADATPSWNEIVPIREERMATVRALVDGVTDGELAQARGEGTLLDCLRVVLDEEWHHNWFANRDLDQLERP